MVVVSRLVQSTGLRAALMVRITSFPPFIVIMLVLVLVLCVVLYV